jgi:hypothetical protein
LHKKSKKREIISLISDSESEFDLPVLNSKRTRLSLLNEPVSLCPIIKKEFPSHLRQQPPSYLSLSVSDLDNSDDEFVQEESTRGNILKATENLHFGNIIDSDDSDDVASNHDIIHVRFHLKDYYLIYSHSLRVQRHDLHLNIPMSI